MEEHVRHRIQCAARDCQGNVTQWRNVFLHTLGPDNRVKPDFGEFVECEIWRCSSCESIQLFAKDSLVRVPTTE